jgi:CubicO group peptidase (beta-lactamase class C family)
MSRLPRSLVALLLVLGAASAALAQQAQVAAEPERFSANTPRATSAGHTFTAPEGFSLLQRGVVTVLQPPEGDLSIALVDVTDARDADDALASAWAAYRPDAKRPLKLSQPQAARDGWEERRAYTYETSPNERILAFAGVRRSGTNWIVLIGEGAESTFEKRAGPIGLLANSLRPKGYARESFAGRRPHPLDDVRIAMMKAFVADGMKQLGVPGVGFSLIDGNRVVFEGGLGVRALGKPAPVDAHTRFIAASNTKAMTTLLLAQAVDAGLLKWDQPVVQAYPGFRLGDPEIVRQVLIRHLVCACTGMPRQDLEWLFESGGATAATTFQMLAGMRPTSKFGEVFQYSNLMVSAAGYVAGARLAPGFELGRAYDEAMRKRVFVPLKMNDSTFNFALAMTGNFASPHGEDIDGRTQPAAMDLNRTIFPARPAGGLWTSPHDLSRFVLMELAEGRTPEGRPIVSAANLRARREPQIIVGEDITYGMGLIIDKHYGIEVIHHGGDLSGYHSDMIWLPAFGIGATVLTNSDAGVLLRGPFLRKLLEVLFDGKPEADEQLRVAAANRVSAIKKERERLMMPPDAKAVVVLAPRYRSPELGALSVTRAHGGVTFDFGEWRSRVASRVNDDGSISFISADPGVGGFDFVVGNQDGKPILTLRDAQHEYRFVAE